MWISNLIGKEFSCHENRWGFDSLLVRIKSIINIDNGKVRFSTRVMKIISGNFWLVGGRGNSSGSGDFKWFDRGRFSYYLWFFVSCIACVDT